MAELPAGAGFLQSSLLGPDLWELSHFCDLLSIWSLVLPECQGSLLFLGLRGGSGSVADQVRDEIYRSQLPSLRGGGHWVRPRGTSTHTSCTSPHTSLSYSLISFCFCVESCFLFALTHQKLPPFCQQGYLRMQGLMGTESLRRHGIESGLLRDYATVGRPREDGGQRPVGSSPAPGLPVQPLDGNKEEL